MLSYGNTLWDGGMSEGGVIVGTAGDTVAVLLEYCMDDIVSYFNREL